MVQLARSATHSGSVNLFAKRPGRGNMRCLAARSSGSQHSTDKWALCSAAAMLLSQLFIALPTCTAKESAAQSEQEQARHQLVDELVADLGLKNKRVIDAMRRVPRHHFVPRSQRQFAYEDRSLPIGRRQTISAPWAVAYMTERLDPKPTDRVLEIGTGSGYQAAVLSGLTAEVYTIEIVESLGKRAQRTLERLEYDNVKVRIGDGFKGWPEKAPFDKIIVTCSPEKVPQPLVDQLQEGGRMLIPVGKRYQQRLYLMEKKQGQLVEKELIELVFVPMTGVAEQLRQQKPDPTNPQLFNGGFEQDENDDGQPDGWHYRRGAKLAQDDAPQGKSYVAFHNDIGGKEALALQVTAIDGGKVKALDASFWVRVQEVQPGPEGRLPHLVVSFYDANRRFFHYEALGPWSGTSDWRKMTGSIPVPLRAREAIVRIGLLGATGEVDFDEIEIRAVLR